MMDACRVCGNSADNTTHVAREMFFGLREEFPYFECSRCGCLQIGVVPDDPGKYYPPDYYSFEEQTWATGRDWGSILRRTKLAIKYLFFERLRLAGLAGKIRGKDFKFPIDPAWFRRSGLDRNARILDVGCGGGELLVELATVGFTRLVGIDPYLERDILHGNGVVIYKKRIDELSEPFDLIMFNHSFEHVPEPRTMLAECRRLTPERGFVLIRTPTVTSHAWREYGTDWVQLDAPRHLCLQSLASIEILARGGGFAVTDVIFESTAFQFWGSEQYRRDVPLMSERSFLKDPGGSIFNPKQIRDFEKRAAQLNERGEGDQICIYLKKE